MCRKSFSPSEVIPYCIIPVLLLLFLFFFLVPRIGKYVIHLLVIQLQCLFMVTGFLMLFMLQNFCISPLIHVLEALWRLI